MDFNAIIAIKTQILLFVLCMARMAILFRIVPFLGPSHLGILVRNAIVVALTFLIFPVAQDQLGDRLFAFDVAYLVLVLKEILLGLFMGYLISLVFWMASGVGFVVDNQRGASMAQGQDPLSGETSSPLGNLVFQTLVMVFIASGGLLLFLGLVMDSYAVWPVLSFRLNWSRPELASFFVYHLDLFMAGIILLAAPMLIICFLVDFCMGLMNRFAPQLNVFFLSMPIKSGLAGVMLVAYWFVLFAVLKDRLYQQYGVLRDFQRLLS